MGWDTEIVIIAESIKSKEISIKIGKEIFNTDSKRYGKESFYVIETNPNFAIYYAYERRKYAPYWIVQEISKNYKNVSFTILGTMLDFLCGPGGIIKIQNGVIIDSYGIWGENSMRHQVLNSPIENKQTIFDWFKTNGLESKLRLNFLNDFPLGWCDDNLVDKVIPIDEDRFKDQIENNKEEKQKINWEKQINFSVILPYDEYYKNLVEKPQDETEITEKSFISFIEYNKIVEDIDKEALVLVGGEIYESGHFFLYDTTFGQYSHDKEFLEKRFTTIQDIEDDLKKHRKEILDWGLRNLGDSENVKIGKGFSIKWLINVLKGIEKKPAANKG